MLHVYSNYDVNILYVEKSDILISKYMYIGYNIRNRNISFAV